MAISAINSININNVAFKGSQTAAKPVAKEEDNGFLEDRELLAGLSLAGLAILGAVALSRRGKADKAAEAAQEAVVSMSDRHYQGAIGTSNIRKMQNAVKAAYANELIEKVEASRAASEKNIEIIAQKAKDGVYDQAPTKMDAATRKAWIRANEAKVEGKEIDPEDFIAYAKVEGLNLADFVK